MSLHCIYRIEVNGKYYYGQTKDLKERMRGHKKDLKSGNTRPLYNAWRKHKKAKLKIILRGVREDFIDAYEMAAIKYFDSQVPNGYNLEGGGNANKVVSEETKQKLRDINTGKKHSEETKQKLSKLCKGQQRSLGYRHTDESKQRISNAMSGEKHPMFGKTHTLEVRQHLSDLNSGRNNPHYKDLDQYKEWILKSVSLGKSYRWIAKKLKITHPTIIRRIKLWQSQ